MYVPGISEVHFSHPIRNELDMAVDAFTPLLWDHTLANLDAKDIL
jgi:hypothetical protein